MTWLKLTLPTGWGAQIAERKAERCDVPLKENPCHDVEAGLRYGRKAGGALDDAFHHKPLLYFRLLKENKRRRSTFCHKCHYCEKSKEK